MTHLKNSENPTVPEIFDCGLIEKNGKKLLRLGIASVYDIQRVRLIPAHSEHERKEIEAPKNTGIQHINMDELNLHSQSSLLVQVEDVQGQEAAKRIDIRVPRL